jgi:hypothetical protein
VRTLLEESFAVLAREQPPASARLHACLEGLSVALRVGAEHFAVGFTGRGARLREVDGGERAQVSTSQRTLLEVLDGQQSLAEAVLADAVEVVGPLEILLRLHEGLLLYVHGAVRCPGFPLLLRRLRTSFSGIGHTQDTQELGTERT